MASIVDVAGEGPAAVLTVEGRAGADPDVSRKVLIADQRDSRLSM